MKIWKNRLKLSKTKFINVWVQIEAIQCFQLKMNLLVFCVKRRKSWKLKVNFWPKNWTKNLPKNLTKIWVFYISGKALVTAAFLQKSTVLSNRRQQNLDGQFSARFSNAIEPSLPLMTSGKNFRGLGALCSRNFQNVKLRLDFVEIRSFYRHSQFMWNQIWANSNGSETSFLTISETLNFEFLVNLGLEVAQIY